MPAKVDPWGQSFVVLEFASCNSEGVYFYRTFLTSGFLNVSRLFKFTLTPLARSNQPVSAGHVHPASLQRMRSLGSAAETQWITVVIGRSALQSVSEQFKRFD